MWCNNREDESISERPDRCLANSNWHEQYPDAWLIHETIAHSNHLPFGWTWFPIPKTNHERKYFILRQCGLVSRIARKLLKVSGSKQEWKVPLKRFKSRLIPVADSWVHRTKVNLKMCNTSSGKHKPSYKNYVVWTRGSYARMICVGLRKKLTFGWRENNFYGNKDRMHYGWWRVTKTHVFSTQRHPTIDEKITIWKIRDEAGVWKENEDYFTHLFIKFGDGNYTDCT